MTPIFRINRLSELTARALDELALSQSSARVRGVPDVRTIRYYTTLGLLDRPAEMKGRTAFYGPRHVLQLMAIKRLQAGGKTLVEVQQELAGAEDGALRRHAGVAPEFLKQVADWATQSNGPPVSGDRERQKASDSTRTFWQQPPQVSPQAEIPPVPVPRPGATLRLGPHISLLLDDVDVSRLDDAAIAQLQPAIQDLLKALQSVGIEPGSRSGAAHSQSSGTSRET